MPRTGCMVAFVCVMMGVAAMAADTVTPTEATQTHVMIPMRDGVKLATDVYRPARGGKAVAGRGAASALTRRAARR